MSNGKKHHPSGPWGPYAGMPQSDMMCPPGTISPAMQQPNMKLAHAYVPYQQYTAAFNPMEALKKGTLFPELYSPYIKKGGC